MTDMQAAERQSPNPFNLKCLDIAEKMLDVNLTRDGVPDVSGLRGLLSLVAAYVAIANDGKGEFASTQVVAAVIALHKRDQTFEHRISELAEKVRSLQSTVDNLKRQVWPELDIS